MSTRLVVVRHGETRWNREGRVQGHADSPLSPTGEVQASAIGERLAKERFDRLVSSDLGRALQTAGAIAACTGLDIVTEPRLRERHYGMAEGLTYDEIALKYPDIFSRVRDADPDYAVPGGESRRQLYERVCVAFDALAQGLEGRSAVVVCHGGVLAALYRHVHAIALGAAQVIAIPNAAYNALVYDRGHWLVETWADTNHLATTDPFEEP